MSPKIQYTYLLPDLAWLVGKDHGLQAPRTLMLTVPRSPSMGQNSETKRDLSLPATRQASFQLRPPSTGAPEAQGQHSFVCTYSWAWPSAGVPRALPALGEARVSREEDFQLGTQCEDWFSPGRLFSRHSRDWPLLSLGLPGSSCSDLLVSSHFPHPVPHHCPAVSCPVIPQEGLCEVQMAGLPPLAVCNPRIPIPGFPLGSGTEPSPMAWGADMGCASAWRPPEPGVRQVWGVTETQKQDTPEGRKGQEGQSMRITLIANGGRMRDFTPQSQGPQSLRQQPERVRDREHGRGHCMCDPRLARTSLGLSFPICKMG